MSEFNENPIQLLTKQKSVKIRDQGQYGDCFSYAEARFIRKLVSNILSKEKPNLGDIFNNQDIIEKYFDNLHDYIISIVGCNGIDTFFIALLINDLKNENDVIWRSKDEEQFFYDKSNCSISGTCNFISKNTLNGLNINKNYEKFYYLLPSEITEFLTKDEYIKILNLYDISVHKIFLRTWDMTIIPPPILLKTLDDGYYSIFDSHGHSTCINGYQILDDGTYNFIIKNSGGEDWEQDYSFNKNFENKVVEAILNIKNFIKNEEYDIHSDYKFGQNYLNEFFIKFKESKFFNKETINQETEENCIKLLEEYYIDIAKQTNFYEYFYEYIIINKLSTNINELQKTDSYFEWIDKNNSNLIKYYERKTSYENPNYKINKSILLKFNEFFLNNINIKGNLLMNFFLDLAQDIHSKKIEEYKKKFKYTKGVINMNNNYHKQNNKPNIILSIPIVNKKTEIKTILHTENNGIENINKEFEINYKGDYYEENDYKIYHGNGLLIIKENNFILFYCIGIFENGWIKKGLLYYYLNIYKEQYVYNEQYQYIIQTINKDKLQTLKYNLDKETLEYNLDIETLKEYSRLLNSILKEKKITDISIIESDIKEKVNIPELKEILSFNIYFNKGGKRRKTTKRNRYKKRKLRTKKRK